MGKTLILAILCVIVVALIQANAVAYREYATATGKPCSYCHLDPDGGGPLTAAGEYYFDHDALPPALTVASITPSSGPNAGTTSVTNLAGTGFLSGATVKLKRTGYADITATGVNVISLSSIACAINLTGKKTGLWDVVVTNFGGVPSTLPGGFGIGLPTSAPIAGTSIHGLLAPPVTAASLSRQVRVWGNVELIDSSTFWLGDGSGTRIKVFAPGYSGLINGSYASATGGADVSTSPPTLISTAARVVKHK